MVSTLSWWLGGVLSIVRRRPRCRLSASCQGIRLDAPGCKYNGARVSDFPAVCIGETLSGRLQKSAVCRAGRTGRWRAGSVRRMALGGAPETIPRLRRGICHRSDLGAISNRLVELVHRLRGPCRHCLLQGAWSSAGEPIVLITVRSLLQRDAPGPGGPRSYSRSFCPLPARRTDRPEAVGRAVPPGYSEPAFRMG